MDYNMEVINSAAEQLAEMLKAIVISQQQQGQGGISIAQIEGHLREVVRHVNINT